MPRRSRPGRGIQAVAQALLAALAAGALALPPAPPAGATPAAAPLAQAAPPPPGPSFTRQLFSSSGDMMAVGDLTGDGDLDLVAVVNRRSALIPGDGRGGFLPARPFGAAGEAYTDAAVGDLDGDGDLDLIVARRGLFGAFPPAPAAVYRNDGAGGLALTGTAGDLADLDLAAAELADVDGDGDLDLFYTIRETRLWLNDGAGAFTAAGPTPQPYAFGDVNADGRLDMLGPGGLHLGDGAGGFTSAEPNFGFAEDGGLGDLDGDGDLDIVVDFALDANPIAAYLNDGQGRFGAPVPFAESTVSYPLELGDMDGDGDLDVVAGYEIHFNDGAGAMGAAAPYAGPASPDSLALADLDHDGALDVLALDGQGFIYRNGGGAFGKAVPIGASDDFAQVAAGDLNGDGAPDLVSGNGDRHPTYLLSDGAGGYLAPRVFPGASPPPTDGFTGSARAMAVADVDGDGNQDVVVSRYKAAGSIFLGDGAGGFPAVRAFGGADDAVLGLTVADVDLDGDRDLVTAQGLCTAGQSIPTRVFINGGQGSFAESRVVGSAARSTGVAVADLNGDGRPDLVEAGGWCLLRDRVYVSFADAAGGFGPALPLGPPGEWVVAPVDVDGDGDLDIAAAAYSAAVGGRIFVNDGGAFAEERVFSEQGGIDRIDAADFDGDGDQDLLTVGYEEGLFLNDGAGNFSPGPASSGVSLFGPRVVADFDADGDQDLFLAAGEGDNHIHRNDGAGVFTPDAAALGRFSTFSSAALGDVDGDGDLDVVGEDLVFLNDGAGSMALGRRFDSVAADTLLGDLDGDGDLDVVGEDLVFLNDGAGDYGPGSRPSPGVTAARSALGDVDADGDLDLVEGAFFGSPGVMRNDGAGNFGGRESVGGLRMVGTPALGDLDGDGDLDMALANNDGPPLVALNDGGGRFVAGPPAVGPLGTDAVALGDLDGDGDLDMVASGANQPATAFFNDGAGAFTARPPFGVGDEVQDLELADLDGDGDLDALTVADNNAQHGDLYVRYLNDGAGSFSAGRVFAVGRRAPRIALGDLDGDGLPDLVSPQGGDQSYIYFNRGGVEARLPNSPPAVSLGRPGDTADAEGFSSAEVLAAPTIAVPFRLSDPEGDPVARVEASFSLDGGGSWRPAVPVSGTLLADLPTRGGPGCDDRGCAYSFPWDTFASGVFGSSDRVVFRLVAFAGVGAVGGSQRRPAPAAISNPFRVRGTQVRVLDGDGPVQGATVYRLRSGLGLGGAPLGGARPRTTAADGFLPGRGELGLGDRLFAIAPITSTGVFTVYATSGAPTEQGVDSAPVAQPGVQTLRVSPERPLILFDLLVAVEWDASRSPGYLDELSFNLRQASRHLYDFTDGQVALGNVTVSQRADDWAAADVVVQANNRVRPFAVQGGVAVTTTVDPERPAIVYEPGQVRMGATWNRFGTPGQSLGEDWALILAHELSHYLLYLDDAYLGLDDAGLLVPVGGCRGSAMGDLYSDPTSTEFIFGRAYWDANCARSLGARSLGRTEWATIELWYPWLSQPTAVNPGPATMPFELTAVQIDPVTDSLALDDPSFYLDYAGGAVSSTEARAFLLRDDRYAFDLGSPFGGQNRLLAYGAQPGDRICVFDRPRAQLGCEPVALGDDRITLARDDAWSPLITLSPVTSATLALSVAGVPPGLDLRARLFPEFGEAGPAVGLAPAGEAYTATFPLDDQTLTGSVQVWVEEPAAEEAPRRESIVSFSVAGNPGFKRGGGGFKRGGGGFKRGGGGFKRGGGGFKRGGGAPVVSPDGQMIFFTPNPAAFREGELYTILGMAGLPPIPPGKTVVGQGHSLVATPGSPVLGGSVSFQYLPNDALVAGVREEDLTIHFNSGRGWEALATTRDPYFNLASAASRGPGIYALMAGASAPSIAAVSPPSATAGPPLTLSIAGAGFLPPVAVTLAGPGGVYTATLRSAAPGALEAQFAAGLPAAEYRLTVTNGDGSASAPVPFAVYPPTAARFADSFESGAGRWTLEGEWGLVPLPGGGAALTDSPGGNYASAAPGARRRTSATSAPFSLDGLGAPELRFRHSYILALVGASRDEGRVEISTDGGATWRALATFSGGGIYGPAAAALGDEWAGATWGEARISLAGYAGTARLRFTLDVDGTASDRGWVIDDVVVGEAAGPAGRSYLPLVMR